MNKKRIIYTGLLILVAVIVSIASFSYAYLTKVDEQHGKINVVVGTLKYRIDSNDLNNNSITVDEKTVLDIYVESLNDIASKYELYYTTDNSDVVVEYIDSDSLDPSSGEIDANERKHIQARINTTNEATVVFGIKSGFISNELTLDTNENSLEASEIVLPPTITGGSNNWVSSSTTISMAEEGTATRGIENYEYYLTQSETLPTETTVATGTTSDSLVVSNEGTNYVYYRTVSKLNNKSEWSSRQVVKIDKGPNVGTLSSAPSTANSITANYGAASSLSGIKTTTCYYGTTNNPGTLGTVSGNNCVFNSLAANTTYYFKKCVTNNVNTTTCSVVSNKITAGQVYNYAYTGGVQSLVTPYAGTYKLEVWGAQGGSISGYTGGYGGYATGNKHFQKSQAVYIVVGGAGAGASNPGQSLAGGYNGGGSVTGNSGVNHITASGGGATHMATTNRGVLSAYNSYRSEVLIVAGGGGGARNQANHENAARWGNGGAGGGTTSSGAYSNYGTTTVTQSPYCIATQTVGYSFGQGEAVNGNSAGGGGYMGGYSGSGVCGYYLGSGSGGSGYTGGVSAGSMTNGQRAGNGYARVTILSID